MIPPRRYNAVSNAPLKPAMTRFVFAAVSIYSSRPCSCVDLLLAQDGLQFGILQSFSGYVALALLEVGCHLHCGTQCRVCL